jgi:hypothetical protein
MDELKLLRKLRAHVPAPSAAVTARARSRLLERAASPRPRRRRLTPRRAALAGALAVALTLALWAVSTVELGGRGAGASAQAATLLHRAAAVAAAQPELPASNDQYVFVESRVSYAGLNDQDRLVLPPAPRLRRIWQSVDGSRPGLLREPGTSTALEPNPQPSLGSTYRLLQSLPTDPHRLLERIYTDTKGTGPNPQQEAFVTIGDLVRESIVPPKVRAALYQAAALIPGVELVANAVDAAGRHGVAVARTHDSWRTELIFDRTTLGFLGERQVLVKSWAGLAPGSVIGTSAVLRSAIVDRPGQLPR